MTEARDSTVDTRLMAIIHRAFLRDLNRLGSVLALASVPDSQRSAAADHSLWLMELLRTHEQEEDVALWPQLRAASPDAVDLLEEMERDHLAIQPLISEVELATRRWRDDADAKDELLIAVGLLEGVLRPHLRREEDYVLPIAAEVLTPADWEIYSSTKVRGKSKAQLAHEGHWALDDLGPAGAQVITSLIGPAARFVLVHGFGRSYRNAAAARWGGPPKEYGARIAEHAKK